VAVVTGGSRGIGKHIVQTLASNGRSVALLSRSNVPTTTVFGTIPSPQQLLVKAFQCDVSNYKQIQKTIQDVESEMGPIDTLINCAGIAKDDLLIKLKENDLDEQ